jgi:hypothetical protein
MTTALDKSLAGEGFSPSRPSNGASAVNVKN